jgi:hypothetical protein
MTEKTFRQDFSVMSQCTSASKSFLGVDKELSCASKLIDSHLKTPIFKLCISATLSPKNAPSYGIQLSFQATDTIELINQHYLPKGKIIGKRN